MTVKSQRFVLLDGLRGLAAIGVVFHHIGKGFYPPLNDLYLLVDFFFVLSGFVLLPTLPHAGEPIGKSSLRFLRRRFLRFWPMVIAVVLFRVLLWAQWEWAGQPDPIAGRTAGISHFPTSFVAALLLLHLVYPLAREWTGVLWSLSAEWWSNVIALPFTVSRHKWVLPSGLVLGYGLLLLGWVLNQQAIEGVRALGRALVGFFIGLILRRFFDSRKSTFSPKLLVTSVALVLGYFAVNLHYRSGEMVIVGPLFAFFIYQVATVNQDNIHPQVLRISHFLGAMSFGIYAWHPNMQMLLSTAGVRLVAKDNVAQSFAGLIGAGTLIVTLSIVASLLFQKLIDIPLHKKFGAPKAVQTA